MDTKNRYHTDSTYIHVRLEHVAVVIACSILTLLHSGDVVWWRFIAAFLIIDLVGYLPGAVTYRRRDGERIPHVYHHLYNFAHSYLTAALVIGTWALTIDGFEWAMLAIPIHLSGDRGLFGNFFKPTALYFEPVKVAPRQGMSRANATE